MDTKIQQNLVYLADNLTNMDRILLYLIQNDIISLNESDEVRTENTPFNQNVKLLHTLQRKDFPVTTFLEILRNTQNGHCANEIEGTTRVEEKELETPKSLKNIWWPSKKDLIKSLHRRKVGNRLLIEELHQSISNDEEQTVVICESADASKLTGLGGVGKTLTATWYAHHYEKEYDHVIWIDCGENSLLESFQSLARDLDIRNRKKLSKVEEIARQCYESLEEFKCLWIFDNVESYIGEEESWNVLPKHKDNFYCVITSRWRDWEANNGYGYLPCLEINIFGEMESVEFLKSNLKIQYTEEQLKQLSHLLGNLPLAMQLAIAALNSEKIHLKNYIEQTSTKDLENVVDTKFDDYEKTINESVNITLELIAKEEDGTFAKDVLNIFGYIRPDKVEKLFLNRVFNFNSESAIRMTNAIKLLIKYSLITQILTVDKVSRYGHPDRMILLSIHRLLQQVIRHNGRQNEKETLRKILGCRGLQFKDYKVLPFTKFADEELREEFSGIRSLLVSQYQLVSLVKEKRYEESLQLSKFIHEELQSHETKFNYAICLEMNGQLADSIEILEELYNEDIKDERQYGHYMVEMGLLKIDDDAEVTKELVAGHLLISHWKLDNKRKIQKILEERIDSFAILMIGSKKTLILLLRFLSSNLVQSKFTLTKKDDEKMLTVEFDGSSKRIELNDFYVEVSFPLPDDLEELVLRKVHFRDANAKNSSMIDATKWLPKNLFTLEISCIDPNHIILSLESLISIKNVNLQDCSLSIDSANRISPRQLILTDISFIKDNLQKVANLSLTEIVDFKEIHWLQIIGYKNKNISIDLKDEFVEMEYLHLDGVNVVSLKSTDVNGRVNIKKARIERCLLELSTLPSSLIKLSLSDTPVFQRGEIDLPNLKYLKLTGSAYLPYFHSFQLFYLYLDDVNEVNVDMLPLNAKIVRIDNKSGTRLTGGVKHLLKLILVGFFLTEVEEMLPHFQSSQLVLYHKSYYKPHDLLRLTDMQIPTIAIGKINWRQEDFDNSVISKQVDQKSQYYSFHNGSGTASDYSYFREMYLLDKIFNYSSSLDISHHNLSTSQFIGALFNLDNNPNESSTQSTSESFLRDMDLSDAVTANIENILSQFPLFR